MLRTLSITVALLVCAMAANAADKPQDVSQKPQDVSQVDRWIAELDHDQFAVRAAATAKLVNARHAGTIELHIRTAESGSPEARSRVTLVLRNWFNSSDAKVRKVVQATALEWQKSKDPQIARLGRAVVAKPVSVSVVPPTSVRYS